MKSNPVVKNALAEFKENELIVASKLYREKLSSQIGEAAYYKTLQRMCESGDLAKIAKGTYHLPKHSKYGIVPPSETEIVSAFTINQKGTVIGYSLYNALNLTTQISKTVTVMSSSLEGMTKTIRNVVIYRVPLEFTKEVASLVQGLEVLQNFDTIQDLNYSAFFSYTEHLAKSFCSNAFDKILCVRSYKKATISFLREILEYYGVQHNLDSYLSTLSDYKHPHMEEVYETARICN